MSANDGGTVVVGWRMEADGCWLVWCVARCGGG